MTGFGDRIYEKGMRTGEQKEYKRNTTRNTTRTP